MLVAYLWRQGIDPAIYSNHLLLLRARMREAGLSDRFCPSVCQSVCHQNVGLITTTKGLNTCKRHSNNDNSEKIVHGVYT